MRKAIPAAPDIATPYQLQLDKLKHSLSRLCPSPAALRTWIPKQSCCCGRDSYFPTSCVGCQRLGEPAQRLISQSLQHVDARATKCIGHRFTQVRSQTQECKLSLHEWLHSGQVGEGAEKKCKVWEFDKSRKRLGCTWRDPCSIGPQTPTLLLWSQTRTVFQYGKNTKVTRQLSTDVPLSSLCLPRRWSGAGVRVGMLRGNGDSLTWK